MSDQAKAVYEALMALPAVERDAVVEAASAADDEEMTDDEYHDMWGKEIDRRLAELDAGRAELIPHEEVMARLREKYG